MQSYYFPGRNFQGLSQIEGGSLGDLEEIKSVFLDERMLDLNFDAWN